MRPGIAGLCGTLVPYINKIDNPAGTFDSKHNRAGQFPYCLYVAYLSRFFLNRAFTIIMSPQVWLLSSALDSQKCISPLLHNPTGAVVTKGECLRNA